MSVVETITSTAVGFAVSYALLWLVAAWLGWHNTAATNTLVTCLFTAASLARGYAVRRLFNWLSARADRPKPATENYEQFYCQVCDGVGTGSPHHYADCPLSMRSID